jgi:hypothetical protein
MKTRRVKNVPAIVNCEMEEIQKEERESSSKFEENKKKKTNNCVDTEGEQDSESTGTSATNIISVRNTRLFLTALTPLTEPRTF